MARLLLPLLCVALVGCATPGQIPDSDFTWGERLVQADYQEVYRRIRNGFRTCVGLPVIESALFTDIQEAHFDVFLSSVLRDPRVRGRILVIARPPDTLVRAGSRFWAASIRQADIRHWLDWAEGNFTCR